MLIIRLRSNSTAYGKIKPVSPSTTALPTYANTWNEMVERSSALSWEDEASIVRRSTISFHVFAYVGEDGSWWTLREPSSPPKKRG